MRPSHPVRQRYPDRNRRVRGSFLRSLLFVLGFGTATRRTPSLGWFFHSLDCKSPRRQQPFGVATRTDAGVEHFIMRDDLVLGLPHSNQVAELVRLIDFPFANDFRVRLENTQNLTGILGDPLKQARLGLSNHLWYTLAHRFQDFTEGFHPSLPTQLVYFFHPRFPQILDVFRQSLVPQLGC